MKHFLALTLASTILALPLTAEEKVCKREQKRIENRRSQLAHDLPSTVDFMGLYYTTPATCFEEALPIGNGRIGAMVYGGTKDYQLTLNDITLWTGEPTPHPTNADAYKELPAVRKALEAENYAAADTLVMRMQGKETEKYQPLGTLHIELLNINGKVTNYARRLSLNDANATTEYIYMGDTIRTECFASAPDSCIAVKVSTTNTKGLNARISLDCLLPHTITTHSNMLINEGYAAYSANAFYIDGTHREELFYDPQRGIHFTTIVALEQHDGAISAEQEALLVYGCREITLYVVNATSFNGADHDPVNNALPYAYEAQKNIARAIKKGYTAIKKEQREDYQNLFQRVQLHLGQTPNSLSTLPTNEQLRLYAEKHSSNPALETLFFDYGRYLLISGSRTPYVPMTLQGLWNESLSPPWRSNYTVNINLEEIYWPAEETNLSELTQPLLSFIQQLSISGAQTAQAYYNARGWCCGHNSDIWATTEPIGEGVANPQWANWTMGGAWLATYIWEHFLYTRDRTFLQTYYPTLRDAALFCNDWLIEKDGEAITSFSTSPENSYITDEGYTGSTFYGGTADIALIRECLSDAVAAAEELSLDSLLCETFSTTLSRLRPYHIGKRGQLLEWYHDWDDADITHRHQSHLVGVYPFAQITDNTPTLLTAAERSLELKGDETTGWSTCWRAALYARMKKGEKAYSLLRRLVGHTYPNLFAAHPPFQIDGNSGGVAAITEMLLISSPTHISILPALPSAWKSGSVEGLCTRSGATISFAWDNYQVVSLTITATHAAQALTIEFNGQEQEVQLNQGEQRKIL